MYSLILDKGQMMPYIGEFDFTFDTYDKETDQWVSQEMGARMKYDGDGEYVFTQKDTALLGEHIYITLVDDDVEFDYEGNHLTGSAVTFQTGARAGEGYVSYINESGISLRAFFYKDTLTIYDETSGEQTVTTIEYIGFLFSVTSIEGPVPEIETYKYACVNSRYYSPGQRDTYDEHELHYHFFDRETTPDDTAWIGPFYLNKYTTYNSNTAIFDFTDETREINGEVYRVVQKRGGDAKYFESATTEDTSVIYTYSADTSQVVHMSPTAYIWHTKLNDIQTYNSKPVPGIRYNTTSNAVLFNGRKPVVNIEDGHYSEDVPTPTIAQCVIHATYTWDELGITDAVFDRYVRMFRERRPINDFNVYADDASQKWILLEFNTPESIDEDVDPYLLVSSIRFFTGNMLFNVEINREERYVLLREDHSVK